MKPEQIFQINFRYMRRRLNYSRAFVAGKMNVSEKSIGAYEEGRAMPTISNLLVLCDLFDIGLDTLVTIDLQKHLTPLS